MSTVTTKASPRIEVDIIREKLLQLGLTHAAEELPAERAEAVKHNRPAHQMLDRMLGSEFRQREGVGSRRA